MVCQDAPKHGEVVVAHVMRLHVYFNEYGARVRKDTARAGQNARSKPCTSIFSRSTDLDSGTRLSSVHTSTCLLRTTRAAFFAYCFSKNSVLGGRTDAKSETP